MTTPPANPARIAEPNINSRCATVSGYTWNTALAPLAKIVYSDPKKALKNEIEQKNISSATEMILKHMIFHLIKP